jgi:hypothetical protein
MKTSLRGRLRSAPRLFGLLAATLLVSTAAGCVTVRSGDHGGFLMGGRQVIERGEVSRDELVMMGGSVRIDGEARSDVVVLGGSLTVNGTARDVVLVGGTMRVGPDAHIRGDLVNVGGSLNRSPGARVDGEVVNVGVSGLDWVPFFGMGDFSLGRWWGLSPFHVAARTTQLVYWLLLAVLVVALAGDRVSSAAHSIAREPLRFGIIGFVGFFALCLATVFFFVLSLLIIGIPFLLALLLIWWLSYIFGMVAVFQVIGQKLLPVFGKQDASQIGLAVVGGVALSLLHYFPLIGSLFWVIAACIGLGSVFATRFGTNRPWVGGSPAPAGAGVAPPAPPTPPAE